MSEPQTDSELMALRAEIDELRTLASAGLKASISALSGLQALLQGIRVESLLGTGDLPEPSLRQAEEHVSTGLDILKAAIEGVNGAGRR